MIKQGPKSKHVLPGIREDRPDRFLVRVDWTDPRTGQRKKREAVVSSLEEAVAKRKEMKASPSKARPSRVRFADFAERWIVERGERLAPSTKERYINALGHLTVAFGTFYVDGIGPAEIRRWRDRSVSKRAPATINGDLRVLRQALEDAVLDGLLSSNPARKVKAIPEKRTGGKRGQALSVDELKRFLVAIADLKQRKRGGISGDVARLLVTLAWTGCRRGEALALRWSDVDGGGEGDGGELRVERSVWNRHEKATKTDDPRRVVIVGPLAEALEEQRRWLLETQHAGLASGLIFPARPGNAKASATRRKSDEVLWYRTGSVLNEPLARVVELAKIPAVSPHSFRRTYENMLRRAGVDQLVRRSLAGWRSEGAQAIYASVDADERRAAGQAVVAFVMGGKNV